MRIFTKFPIVSQALRLFCMAAMVASACLNTVEAAEPSDFLPTSKRHWLTNADMPPGVAGQLRLTRGGPVKGYFQPVAFRGPEGVEFSLGQAGGFAPSEQNLMAGLLIGGVYRFKITGIPQAEGVEIYPTVELIDRLYPPPGQATLNPIPITIDETDLRAVMQGRMVTRVVYLEDPQTAIALPEPPSKSHVLDLAHYQDPLHEADRFGRPVAIIRIGTVAPPTAHELMPQFFFGYPTWAPIFQPETQQ